MKPDAISLPVLRTIALSLLVAVLSALGCRSAPNRHASAEDKKTLTAAEGIEADSGVVRTDFHREVPPGQRVGVHLELARAMETRGSFEAAVAEYQKAVDEADKHSHLLGEKMPEESKALAHRRMAAALDRLGRFAQAETHYRQALRLAPRMRGSGTTPATAPISSAAGMTRSASCAPPPGWRRGTARPHQPGPLPGRRGQDRRRSGRTQPRRRPRDRPRQPGVCPGVAGTDRRRPPTLSDRAPAPAQPHARPHRARAARCR